METIEISDIPQRRQQLNFDILRINCHFDIEYLRATVREILSQHQPVLKDGYDTYSGIGLQFNDASNPIYDCVEQSSFIDANGASIKYRSESPYSFREKNNLADRLNVIFEVFKSVQLYRGRILQAIPGHRHAEHIDGTRDCRIHIPIFTNLYSLMYFGNQPFHMPADGSAYLCNTSRLHHFVNLGDTERIHAVFLV